LAGFILGASIELLAKLHDVQAFATKCRSYRRRRIRGASLYLQTQITFDFFGHLIVLAVAPAS
jgi:hypothetical protein